jgi:hypothetical protein
LRSPRLRPPLLLVVLIFATACGGTAASSIDAAADAAPDVPPDLAPGGGADAPADAASSDAPSEASSAAACALLDATCLAPFFSAANACFAPSGPCTRSQSGDTTTYCWQNGARYRVASSGNVTWSAAGSSCAHGSSDATMFSLILDVTPAAPLYFFAFDTGDTACEGTPGRSTTDPSIAACPSLQALLAPDVGACTPGACN